jgi:hypothetical protein
MSPPAIREYNSSLEDSLVIVNWEQRGAGKLAGVLFVDLSACSI